MKTLVWLLLFSVSSWASPEEECDHPFIPLGEKTTRKVPQIRTNLAEELELISTSNGYESLDRLYFTDHVSGTVRKNWKKTKLEVFFDFEYEDLHREFQRRVEQVFPGYFDPDYPVSKRMENLIEVHTVQEYLKKKRILKILKEMEDLSVVEPGEIKLQDVVLPKTRYSVQLLLSLDALKKLKALKNQGNFELIEKVEISLQSRHRIDSRSHELEDLRPCIRCFSFLGFAARF